MIEQERLELCRGDLILFVSPLVAFRGLCLAHLIAFDLDEFL
jgi:hypothetical protein